MRYPPPLLSEVIVIIERSSDAVTVLNFASLSLLHLALARSHMAVPFSSTNEQELLAREADSCTTDATVRSWPAEPDSAFELFFSIAATSQWLVEHQLHRVR